MVSTYSTKPCEIKAVLWDGSNLEEVLDFCHGKAKWVDKTEHNPEGCVVIFTLEGNMEASVGDYIIQGLAGEFYPCKPEMFKQKYYLVS